MMVFSHGLVLLAIGILASIAGRCEGSCISWALTEVPGTTSYTMELRELGNNTILESITSTSPNGAICGLVPDQLYEITIFILQGSALSILFGPEQIVPGASCDQVGTDPINCTCDNGYSGDSATACTDVDECSTGTTLCHPDASCLNTVGSFTCVCDPGYTGDGTACSDIDECIFPDPCDINAVCSNSIGSFSCVCNFAWTGDGITCVDFDECSTGTDNCHPNATCSNTVGSFTCACDAGYTGNGIDCSDINECGLGTDNCAAALGVCSNTDGSFACSCVTGYTGDGVTCSDVDECSTGTDNCHPTATCSNTAGSFTCACNTGYTGNGIDCTDFNECGLGTDNCDDTLGVCSNTDGSFTCSCVTGYTGDGVTCNDIDECIFPDPCDINAVCSNSIGSFSCVCNFAWTGDGITCVDFDECSTGTDNCHPNATCSNTVGSFTCACDAGYTGNGIDCSDINECGLGTDNCAAALGVCSNTDGSFACSCVTGYTGDGVTCSDVDECSTGTDNCHPTATCSNTAGSFTCACNTGYTGNGIDCTDFNECGLGTDNCDDTLGVCSNTDGSFTCSCVTGYTGDGVTCNDVNECAIGTDNCDSDASCSNTVGSFSCSCTTGFSGDGITCSDIDECTGGTHNCDANADCRNTVGLFMCVCVAGFTGDGVTCTGSTGVPSNPRVGGDNFRDRVTLSWEEPIEDGPAVSSYEVCYSVDPAFHDIVNLTHSGFQPEPQCMTIGNQFTSLTWVELPQYSLLHFMVRASSAAGLSNFTNPVSEFTGEICPSWSSFENRTFCPHREGVLQSEGFPQNLTTPDNKTVEQFWAFNVTEYAGWAIFFYYFNIVDSGYTFDWGYGDIDVSDPAVASSRIEGTLNGSVDGEWLQYSSNKSNPAEDYVWFRYISTQTEEEARFEIGVWLDGDDCYSSPCLHGGNCTDGDYRYICDCSATDYTGTSCETPHVKPVLVCVPGRTKLSVAIEVQPLWQNDLTVINGFGLVATGGGAPVKAILEAMDREALLIGLDPYTNYEVTLSMAFAPRSFEYQTGKCFIQTLEDVPSIPRNLILTIVGDTLVVQWEPPSEPNGVVEYDLFYVSLDHGTYGENETSVSVNVSDTTFSLNVSTSTLNLLHLKYYRQYEVSVRARTSVGSSSAAVVVGRTPSGPPHPFRQASVTVSESGHVTVSWLFDLDLNIGPVTVNVSTDSSPEVVSVTDAVVIVSDAVVSVADAVVIASDAVGSAATFTDLEMSREHNFTLTAFTGTPPDQTFKIPAVPVHFGITCSQEVGQNISCQCLPGFTGNGTTCLDIDECMDPNVCPFLSFCTNVVGSYTCTCNNGFTGDELACSDINECLEAPCHGNATCSNSVGSYTCECDAGFSGNGTLCFDINECATSPCDLNATCVNAPGSFFCECDLGFIGNGTACADVDECTAGANDCDINANCTNTDGAFSCVCVIGFTGDGFSCSDINECSVGTANCSGSANCTNTIGLFNCSCLTGFTGDGVACTDIDECTAGTADCAANSTCSNTDGSYTCTCDIGFAVNGTQCSDIDECTVGTADCTTNATCSNTDGSYTCTCDAGFVVNGTECSDIDECTVGTADCGTNSTCSNTDGSYTCTCDAGFVVNGTECSDIDECTEGTAGCAANATCSNTEGSYTCTCDIGFTANGTECSDIDECIFPDPCDINAVCSNSIGSYSCTCEPGWTGDGINCTDIDLCETVVCSEFATCIEDGNGTVGVSARCVCNDGFTGNGTICEDIDLCETVVCSEFATCIEDGNGTVGVSARCVCRTGFTGNGTTCEDIDECLFPGVCDSNAVCNNTIGSFLCVCEPGFIDVGGTCVDIGFCEALGPDVCPENAACITVPEAGETVARCICDSGFTGNGTVCEDIDECIFPDPCDINAFCINIIGSYSCVCELGWAGDGSNCTDINECQDSSVCPGPNGRCINTDGWYFCACEPGFTSVDGICVPVESCGPLHVSVEGECRRFYRVSFVMTVTTLVYTQSLSNQSSDDYIFAASIFFDLISRITGQFGLSVFGVPGLNFSPGSVVGTGILGLPINATDNSTTLSQKANDALDSGDLALDHEVSEFTITDFDECSEKSLYTDCHEDAVCINMNPSYQCRCSAGYRDRNITNPGRDCEEQCIPGYCLNGGTCVPRDRVGEPSCDCPAAFGGQRCSETILEEMCARKEIEGLTFPETFFGLISYSEETCLGNNISLASINCVSNSSNLRTGFFDPFTIVRVDCSETIAGAVTKGEQDIEQVTNSLRNIHVLSSDVTTLDPDEVSNITEFFTFLEGEDIELTEENIQDVVEIMSHLSDYYERQDEAEEDAAQKQRTLQSLSALPRKLAPGLPEGKFETVSKDINLQVLDVDDVSNSEDVNFAPQFYDLNNTGERIVPIEIRVPSSALEQALGQIQIISKRRKRQTQTVRIVSVGYRGSALFPTDRKTEWVVSSELGDLNDRVDRLQLDDSVLIINNAIEERSNIVRMDKFKSNLTQLECSFWDFEKKAWSRDGCCLSPAEPPTCVCNHLTNFAILVSGKEVASDVALTVYSYVGCSLSTIGFLLTLTLILWIKKLRGSKEMQIIGNLCACLAFSFILFMAGIQSTGSDTGCSVLAVFLQFGLIASWCWMSVYSHRLYRNIVYPMETLAMSYKLRYACIFAYGFSFLVVLLNSTIALGHVDKNQPTFSCSGNDVYIESAYNARNFCWLRHFSLYFGFVFIVGIFLVFNFAVFIVVTVKLTCKRVQVSSTAKQTSKVEELVRAMILATMMGLSWILGYFMLLSDNEDYLRAMSWLFTIVNAIQGILFFVITCIRNRDVREMIAKKTGIGSRRDTTTSSTGPTSTAPRSPGYSHSVTT